MRLVRNDVKLMLVIVDFKIGRLMETYDGLSRTTRVCDYAHPGTEGLVVPELDGSMTYVPPLPKVVKGFGRPLNKGRFDGVPNKRHLFDSPVGRLGFSLTITELVWDSDDHLTLMEPLKGSKNDKYIRFLNDGMLTPHARVHTPVHLVTIKTSPVYILAEGLVKDRKKDRLHLKTIQRPVGTWLVVDSDTAITGGNTRSKYIEVPNPGRAYFWFPKNRNPDIQSARDVLHDVDYMTTKLRPVTTPQDDGILDAFREHHARMGAPARVKPTDYNPRFAATDDFAVSPKDHKVQRHTPDNTDRWYYIPNLQKHSLYIDLVDDDFEEYSPNIATPSDDLQNYQTLKTTEVDFLGVSPYKKDYKPKVRSFWIGEIYLRNTRDGRATVNIAETIADYFGMSRIGVMYCAKTARESHALGFIKGTDIPCERDATLEGDWVLKNFQSVRNLVPWKTADGIRPWWMWSFAGTTDNSYAALRQQL